MKLSISTTALAMTLAIGVAHAQEAATNKFAPLPYKPKGTYGQALVDMEMAKHPELKVVGLHVTPRGVASDVDAERCIMFSNVGKIGKNDSPAEVAVYRGGQEVIEVEDEIPPPSLNFSISAKPKYEVSTPLKDKEGRSVGLVVTVFPYHENFDFEIYHRIAKEVVADLTGRVPTKDDLFKPAFE